MSNTVIKAENISKQYRLGEISTGSISHDLNRWWHKIRGKENPYLKIGESNDRTVKGESDYVWSLRDINFEIQQGDAVGIIGRNGAGKSTLLKILSKVTQPTTGTIKTKGRIASLLEVGTGFHPELSGRDNIYLNGAILGMRKQEIKRKFDEIVDFAGVERYIDTPVKRYSSGMYVRLAFAVAAYLESEILIVDEVLAVGDAEFQKKCLGKMGEVSKGEGRTILFVSHNMAAVSNLCNSSILLKNGKVSMIGVTSKVVERYIQSENTLSGKKNRDEIIFTNEHKHIKFVSIALIGNRGQGTEFGLDESVQCEIEYEVDMEMKVFPSIHLLDKYGECILATINSQSASTDLDPLFDKVLSPGTYKTTCTIPSNFLNESLYKISAFLSDSSSYSNLTIAPEVLSFQTHDTGEMTKEHQNTWIGQIRPKLSWKSQQIKIA